MISEISRRKKEAIEVLLRRGETPQYISNIINIPIQLIVTYAENMGIDFGSKPELKNWAMRSWENYRRKMKYNRLDPNSYHYKSMRKAFMTGFMITHE